MQQQDPNALFTSIEEFDKEFAEQEVSLLNAQRRISDWGSKISRHNAHFSTAYTNLIMNKPEFESSLLSLQQKAEMKIDNEVEQVVKNQLAHYLSDATPLISGSIHKVVTSFDSAYRELPEDFPLYHQAKQLMGDYDQARGELESIVKRNNQSRKEYFQYCQNQWNQEQKRIEEREIKLKLERRAAEIAERKQKEVEAAAQAHRKSLVKKMMFTCAFIVAAMAFVKVQMG
ncbi:hypothetical protein [Vibrio hippocampi]|uniref:Uncharacterized protein n=1 Tax=Vibrio hippocampi TaxID=654686 RepID=A0ABM8ZFH7_9VIBR|nr:hypothetical protein [Vibrio hippocampi]CAH0524889.1 hypothetical protein VHP8226_00564 [Vibrio hippocampi]